MNPLDVNNIRNICQGRPKKGRKRKVVDQSRVDVKRLRNTNQPYVDINGEVVESKVFDDKFVCSCTKKCTEAVAVELRRRLFKQFWSMGSFAGRCAIIVGCVTQEAKKSLLESRRKVTRKYTIYGQTVCQKAFLKTLHIDKCRVELALRKQCTDEYADERGKFSGGQNAMSLSQKEEVIAHINSFPKYVSHYCRKVTNAKFLGCDLTLSKMYTLYRSSHGRPISFSSYKRIFYDNFNLRFKAPKKDTCQRCDRFVVQKSAATGDKLLKLQQAHQEHLEKAEALENQMHKDLDSAKLDPLCETLTFDLQKTHSLPKLSTNIAYYKRQLNFYNFGIHVGSSGKGIFNVWQENEGSKGTQEVGSCLKKHIERIEALVKKLILWSDACGGQNRSIKLVLILIHALQKHSSLESISLRFRQPGHSFLPNDSEFGDVECKIKKKENIYTDDEYIEIMKTCRAKNPFEIRRIINKDFVSSKLLEKATTNRKVDVNKAKISWLATHEILMEKSNPFLLKMYQRPGGNFQIVNIQKRTGPVSLKDIELEKLWPEGQKLSKEKVKDLQDLQAFLTIEAQKKYSFLENVAEGDFEDDIDGFGESIDFECETEA